jgi:hypothetical protein
MKIRLTESELVSLIKKIITEEKTSVEDIKYTHPRTGKECLIKVARHKHSNRPSGSYTAVLVCDVYDDNEYMPIAELPIFKKSIKDVSDFICNNLDRTFEILDDMLDYDKLEALIEEAKDFLENERGYNLDDLNSMSEDDIVEALFDEGNVELAKKIDKLLGFGGSHSGEELLENYSKFSKWEIVDEPIVCSNLDDEDIPSTDDF